MIYIYIVPFALLWLVSQRVSRDLPPTSLALTAQALTGRSVSRLRQWSEAPRDRGLDGRIREVQSLIPTFCRQPLVFLFFEG